VLAIVSVRVVVGDGVDKTELPIGVVLLIWEDRLVGIVLVRVGDGVESLAGEELKRNRSLELVIVSIVSCLQNS